MKDFKTRDNGTNAAIRAHVLSDRRMRELGFTDYAKDTWYFCRMLHPIKYEISFNVSIKKNNPDDLRIDILDEDFLQPYDYQYMLSNGSTNKVALAVKEQVDKLMMYLIDNGVLSNWQVGDYV